MQYDMWAHLRRHAALATGKSIAAISFCLTLLLAVSPASAQMPRPWQMGLQDAHSPVMQNITDLNDMVLIIITAITIFVAGLLVWVMIRYNAKRNPVPGRWSHNTTVEVLWTVLPVLILVVIAIPSFRLVYFEDRTFNPDLTIKVTGHQWYWEYTYPDSASLDFNSYIVADDALKPGQVRMLAVDNQLVVPAGKNIRILTTSGDVIHSFYIPSLGVQRYAIPGRTIETWVKIDKPGDYYGECNQICGENHSRMPISIHAVTDAEFTAWLAEAKTKFSSNESDIRHVLTANAR
jgi:cytochrome c oxidase subunit 2